MPTYGYVDSVQNNYSCVEGDLTLDGPAAAGAEQQENIALAGNMSDQWFGEYKLQSVYKTQYAYQPAQKPWKHNGANLDKLKLEF